MPNESQLRFNAVRIQAEAVPGDTGDDANVLRCRLSGAEIVRDIAKVQERIDPWRTREFTDIVHQAHILELTGELRGGGFLHWLVAKVATAATSERGLSVYRIAAHYPTPPTFAIQFEGIDGVVTFTACALTRIGIQFRGRRPITYSLTFAALRRLTAEPLWATTETEAGDLLTASGGRIAMATDLGTSPDSFPTTAFEATIELSREASAADFSPDGIAKAHAESDAWDFAGSLLLPESAITATAATGTWLGELNLRAGTGATTFEIEAGVLAAMKRRTGLADDWKQIPVDFASRRASGEPIIRFLTAQPTLT